MFKGLKNRVKNNFLIFSKRRVLEPRRGPVQSLLHFDLKITNIGTPWIKVKRAKSHIFKGFKNGIKNYFFEFFRNKGVLGTHKRGYA
jgi:hypothetical protein